MYEAYATEELVSKLPLDATTIVSCNKIDKLFVGSKQGHLLSINQSSNDKRNYEYQLCRNFEKKAIQAVQVIEPLELIVSLSDGQLSTHELCEPYKLLCTFNKYKPISSFGCYLEDSTHRLFVLICARKKLYLLKWLLNEFDEVQLSFTPAYLPDNASCMTWIGGHSVLFSAKTSYQYCRIMEVNGSCSDSESEVGNVRSISLAPESGCIVSIGDKNMAGLVNESLLAFVDANGMPALSGVRFSETITAISYDAPYLVSLTAKGVVEVRSLDPSLLIQKLSMPAPRFAASSVSRGAVYLASERAVWKLNSRPMARANVEFLVSEGHYDLAVAVAENTDAFDRKRLVEIKRMRAVKLFEQRKFADAFQVHAELGTEVLLVVHYLKFLIPKHYLCKLSDLTAELGFFEPNVNMAENERKLAIGALGDFLSAKRTELARKLEKSQKARKESAKDLKELKALSGKELKKCRETLELVDTVLLKCYLKAKPMLVSSLLRLPDNACVVAEAEADLQALNRPNELFILYEKKQLHRKALELLKRESTDESSPLFGFETFAYMATDYMQTLRSDQLDLVFEFAQPILAKNMEMGLKVFCSEESEVVQGWDSEQIVAFLRRECIDAIVPYLEFLIEKCGEKRPKFHEALAEQYIIKVRQLLKDYIHALADNETCTRGGLEDGELGENRRKLLRFLTDSPSYSPQKVLLLLDDHLIEERALVFGRLKRHEEALAIYTNLLMDFEAAERHCLTYFEPRDPINSQVFFTLFCLYTHPDKVELTGLGTQLVHKLKPNVNEALKLLRNHADKMDTVGAIKLIPRDSSLRKVWTALEAIIDATKNRASHLAVLLAISDLAKQKSRAELERNLAKRVDIDFTVECVLCRKKIATSAFVRYPQTGQIAHFFCYRQTDQAKALGQVRLRNSPSFTTELLKARK